MSSFHDPDAERGIQYANGGVAGLRVFRPDPERMRRINDEWAKAEAEAEVEVEV